MEQTALFAAGCFWGVEFEFSNLKGVTGTLAGYSGGDDKKFPSPSYEMVCTGKTGHAETVQVKFDPKKLSYQDLVEFFFDLHDPTTVNRQGPDIGTQYRSAIFYTDTEQKKTAEKIRDKIQKKLGITLATQIAPAGKFWIAEEYHQKYAEKHGGAACHI